MTLRLNGLSQLLRSHICEERDRTIWGASPFVIYSIIHEKENEKEKKHGCPGEGPDC